MAKYRRKGKVIDTKKPRRIKLKKRLFATLDLPLETDKRVFKLTMVGRCDLLLENHKGVLKYDTKSIRLLVNDGVIAIEGASLELMQLADERAYVKGNIESVEFA